MTPLTWFWYVAATGFGLFLCFLLAATGYFLFIGVRVMLAEEKPPNKGLQFDWVRFACVVGGVYMSAWFFMWLGSRL